VKSNAKKLDSALPAAIQLSACSKLKPLLRCLLDCAASSSEKADDEQNQENYKANFRDAGSSSGDTAKS
jgi:hypothetical protein